ncbi:MAG: DUF3168 domain-containing protein [Alphaproteobacteria bacterium]|nr:DUF3168 domain-containing protein [Alphaproteobacteria bacterium]MBL6938813.1 DUF3168 domain-containing protein [Alphaproteobacteria bacterium]MBL7097830.1 DUF3168 domain-containing protein [Alphaproteobacteria bacterium]
MTAASWALQQAVFAALAADENIKDIVDDPPRIYDSVPRGAPFPYIVIGESKESDAGTATDSATAHTITIHVWSRAPGTKESRVATAAVVHSLNGAALTITGHTLVDLRWLDTDIKRDSDGETIHAAIRFRALTEPSE